MKEQITIKKMTLRRVALPMHSSFETAFGKLELKETVIVELEDEQGNIGFGEGSTFFAPIYSEEDVDTCIYVIKKFLSKLILFKTFTHPAEIHQVFQGLVGNNIAKAGVEFAFWDLYAQRKKCSFKQLFGGDKAKIKVKKSIGIKNSLEDVFEEIRAALAQKLHAVKIKIKPGWDVAVIAAVREKYPDLDLMVDGNSGYIYEEHASIFKELDKFNLTMIEQPFQGEDLYFHSLLQKEIKTPICLDESIKSVLSMKTAIGLEACKIVNIKPARLSGIVETLEVIELAHKNNIKVWVGGLLETGIGRALNISLASMKEMSMVNDISAYQEFYEKDIVTDSFKIEDGYVTVRDNVGLGFDVNLELLEQLTVEKHVFE